jgi:hypothetical protein
MRSFRHYTVPDVETPQHVERGDKSLTRPPLIVPQIKSRTERTRM